MPHADGLPRSAKHSPKLVQRVDGRFKVRCPQCERMREQPRPIGIGLPITNRAEAVTPGRSRFDC